jgi:hypothetical protein
MPRNIGAGVAIGFLSFFHNNKAIMITGAAMLIVGAVMFAYLSSVLVHDYTSGNISPLDARPYPVYGIISPLYAQIASIIIAIIGLGLLVWGVSGTNWAKPEYP